MPSAELGDEAMNEISDLKIRKGLRYLIFSIEGRSTIVVEERGERSMNFDDFRASLAPEGRPCCRYGLIDLDFTTDDGQPTSKLVFISWLPDDGGIRDKMLYSQSKDVVDSGFLSLTANNRSELDLESAILPVCRKFA